MRSKKLTQLWLVCQIQKNEGLMTRLEVNKLTNKEKNVAVVVTRHTNITMVMLMRISLLLKTYLITSSLGPIYHVVIEGK